MLLLLLLFARVVGAVAVAVATRVFVVVVYIWSCPKRVFIFSGKLFCWLLRPTLTQRDCEVSSPYALRIVAQGLRGPGGCSMGHVRCGSPLQSASRAGPRC